MILISIWSLLYDVGKTELKEKLSSFTVILIIIMLFIFLVSEFQRKLNIVIEDEKVNK
jgi:hypothetical protein